MRCVVEVAAVNREGTGVGDGGGDVAGVDGRKGKRKNGKTDSRAAKKHRQEGLLLRILLGRQRDPDVFTAYFLASFREIPNRSGFAARQWITTLRLGTSHVDIVKKSDRG